MKTEVDDGRLHLRQSKTSHPFIYLLEKEEPSKILREKPNKQNSLTNTKGDYVDYVKCEETNKVI